MKIIINNNLEIYDIEDPIKKVIQKELIFDNPRYIEAINAGRSTFGIDPNLYLFNVDDYGTYYLPRGYKDRLIQLSELSKVNYEVVDNRCITQDIIYEHAIQPYQYQYDALVTFSKHADGILVSPAGSGKTIMGLCLIIMIKTKTLWITHTTPLANQFEEAAREFINNLSENDIGHIGFGKRTIGNKITIGMVQTLVRNPNLINKLSHEFGLIIVDEAHHTPATTFTNVVRGFNPYFLIGLTATPKRRDGLWSMAEATLGPIRHIVPRQEVETSGKVIVPTVIVRRLNTTNINEKSYHTLLESLMFNDHRNNIIINDVVREATKPNNICIIVTERREHAEILYNKLGNKAVIATGKYSKKKVAKAIKDLHDNNSNILICTSSLLGEGFNFKPLNRLFITLPFRDELKCEQVSGRVQRPYKTKIDALIYDYVDITSGLAKHQFSNKSGKDCRLNVYKRLKFNVEYH